MTLQLPRALAPWAHLLDLFAPPLALGLGGWVRKLALAIGPLATSHPRAGDTPVGYGGLSRRGTYERLLMSEWLLAEELPDEFLRRAAMGEHLFLRVDHAAPAGSRGSLMLLDVGPGQLGSPRLVHLAALIVLARRAETAGAEFAWGIVQDGSHTLRRELSSASVGGLLAARSGVPANAAMLESWQASVGTLAPDDAWLVTDARLATATSSAAWPPARLAVADVLEPGVSRVDVAVVRARRSEARVVLELPAPVACLRLLRDPFADRPAAPGIQVGAIAPHGGLVFLGPAMVAARTRAGAVLIGALSSKHREVRRPWRFEPPPGERVLALDALGGRVQVVTVRGDDLTVYFLAKNGGRRLRVKLERPLTFRVPGADEPLQSCHVFGSSADFELTLTDADQRLFRLGTHTLPAKLPPYQVLAMRKEAGRALTTAVVREIATKLRPSLLVTIGPAEQFEIEADLDIAPDAFMGGTQKSALVGLVHSGGRVRFRRNSRELHAPSGMRVVGVMEYQQAPAIVVQEDEHQLACFGIRPIQWPRAGAPITAVAVSPYGPLVAYLTTVGELVVHRAGASEHLARLFGSAT